MLRIIALSLFLPWLIPAAEDESVKGSGTKATETREVEGIQGIDLRIPADLRVTIGEPGPLTIEADDNILPLIKTEVRDGTLIISSDREYLTKDAPDIQLTLADLSTLSVSGGGDVWVNGLDNKALSVSATGAPEVRLAGSTDSLVLTATGAADVFAYDLATRKATATLVGAADVELSVAEELIATLTGGCDLHYKGDPEVTKTIIGGGDIKQVRADAGT
jgi:hypothetical protein